ncbi:hypothetical protein LINGRAHAP2_LOCUS23414, partial [Linum grandiflorum]
TYTSQDSILYNIRGLIRHQGVETKLHDNTEEVRTINREFKRRSHHLKFLVEKCAAHIWTYRRTFQRTSRDFGHSMSLSRPKVRGALFNGKANFSTVRGQSQLCFLTKKGIFSKPYLKDP